jgi:tRNA1(Val) A37 N6-methylase TrmN6
LAALSLTAKNYFKNFGKDKGLERLELIQADYHQWVDDNVANFDFIISNPPYIPHPKIQGLEKQVR